MTTFKIKSWPWKEVCGESFDESEPIENVEEEFEKVIDQFIGMIVSHPQKKSKSDEVASQDEINNFAGDAGITTLDDIAYKQLKPDKKMNMVKVPNWKKTQLGVFTSKKKKPDAKIAGSILKKMQAGVADMKTKLDAQIEKRAAEAAKLKLMNAFFNASKAGNVESLEEQLKANDWLLNIPHPQKGGATPVMAAVREKQMGSLKFFLEKKCDLTIEDNFNYTALNWAKDDDLEEFVKVLTDAGCPEGAGSEEEDESEDEGFHAADIIA
mmetsp:Transcript_11689/g.16172  ORF Transcript_11689/g.16172 Transcript_11689/m.16172 type:complete len:268 (-) Transcript_11689:309-1112(-)|eukprot:CAMPEP_0185253246 /NCGR_PEP_ID=MMETSP1359-20130426/2081_1 /TAXON_ID=552665 /ORGANISM="Bigelowiella longifila, Strain CCMP242" /LENGTH=267 /DNA_ID=CAMNT_0027835601 /DNA_START=69 /DNA_END=872 /DNA_ORIENTATION=-